MSVGEFSSAVREAAEHLIEDGWVSEDETYPGLIWWVRSSDGSTLYRVQTDYLPRVHALTWVTCTCPHGMNAGGGLASCKHAAAVVETLWRDLHGREREWAGEPE